MSWYSIMPAGKLRKMPRRKAMSTLCRRSAVQPVGMVTAYLRWMPRMRWLTVRPT